MKQEKIVNTIITGIFVIILIFVIATAGFLLWSHANADEDPPAPSADVTNPTDTGMAISAKIGKEEEDLWVTNIELVPGDNLHLRAYYANTSDTSQQVAIKVSLPEALQYVDGSTISHTNNTDYSSISEDTVHTQGLLLGEYRGITDSEATQGENVYVEFDLRVRSDSSDINYAGEIIVTFYTISPDGTEVSDSFTLTTQPTSNTTTPTSNSSITQA